jgi:hypothetical protein
VKFVCECRTGVSGSEDLWKNEHSIVDAQTYITILTILYIGKRHSLQGPATPEFDLRPFLTLALSAYDKWGMKITDRKGMTVPPEWKLR